MPKNAIEELLAKQMSMFSRIRNSVVTDPWALADQKSVSLLYSSIGIEGRTQFQLQEFAYTGGQPNHIGVLESTKRSLHPNTKYHFSDIFL